jgi:phage terminase large subunit
MSFAGWFLPPWDSQQLYPRQPIEWHMALCRALHIPEKTPPALLKQHMDALADDKRKAVEDFGRAAVAKSDVMFSYRPADHVYQGDPFQPLYAEPGSFDHLCYHGGRGGAKSTEIAKALVHHARSRKETIVCAREFQNSIEASSYSLVVEQIHAVGAQGEFKITDHEISHKTTGSTFAFVGLARNIASIKSMTGVSIFWIEEAENIKALSIEVLLPTVRNLGSRLIWSYNPDKDDSSVDDLFRGKDVPESSIVIGVNPEHNRWLYRTRMPKEMRSLYNKHPKRFNHVWRGDYARNSEAQIFDRVFQHYIDVPHFIEPVFGMDFGYRDPQTLVRAYVVPIQYLGGDPELHRDVIYIAMERYEVGSQIRNLEGFMDSVLVDGAEEIVCDSSDPAKIAHLQSLGYNALGAVKGPGSIRNGLNWMATHDIYVHPSCPHAYREFTKLRWKTDPVGKLLDEPEAGNDHVVDAARYATEAHQRGEVSDHQNGGVDFLDVSFTRYYANEGRTVPDKSHILA